MCALILSILISTVIVFADFALSAQTKGLQVFIEDRNGKQIGLYSESHLLFHFSGHGYTRKSGNKGYLVPTDAPNPYKDEKGVSSQILGHVPNSHLVQTNRSQACAVLIRQLLFRNDI